MIFWAWRTGYMVQLFSTLTGLTRRGACILSATRLEKFVVHVPDTVNYVTDEDKWLEQFHLLDGLKFPTMTFGTLGPVSDKVRTEIEKRGPLRVVHFTDKKPLDDRRLLFRTGPSQCAFAGKRLDQWSVWPNGDISVCFFDYGHENIIGNLAREGYEEIKKGAGLATYRRKMLSQSDECLCRHCEEARPC
jgi:radical SAM protein with 4Fe4S-binding SPASM domain